MNKKILHISNCDKFIPPYIEFVKENFIFNEHKFFISSGMAVSKLPKYSNIFLAPLSRVGKIQHYLRVAFEMNKADKVIIHSLFDFKVTLILFSMPWILKKSYWIMWGGDLYTYKLGTHNLTWKFHEFFRRPVIKNLGYFSTTVTGDFDLVKKWYGSKSKFIQNLMYPSHLYREIPTSNNNYIKKSEIFIQVGNSADPTNNHHEILKYISELSIGNYKVFCPLSYGSKEHQKSVIAYGKHLLGNKFIPMTTYMDFSEYNEYMDSIDIAIFNHDRQQAMGNMIGLLSLGKKVILKSSITPYSFFKSLGLHVYSLEDKDLLNFISNHAKEENMKIMRSYFSPKRLKSDWDKVFYG